MNELVEEIRLAIYRTFAEDGYALNPVAAAFHTGHPVAEVEEAFDVLHERRQIVIDSSRRIILAHPFANRNFGFSVMGKRTIWWGGCAWDSFAIPHLVPGDDCVLVATNCPACNAPHSWNVSNSEPPAGAEVVHFLTPMNEVWDDVAHACSNQRIFCTTRCVTDWLARTNQPMGAIFDLSTLWRLASSWYQGRLDSPYVRRDPTEAGTYFASLGLTGPFWGNQSETRTTTGPAVTMS